MTSRELFQLCSYRESARAAEKLFRRERIRISRRLPGAIIEHCGATSVRRLATKGDLDIVVRVLPEDFLTAERALAGMYERNLGSDRSESFAAFLDERSRPQLGVQLVSIGSEHDDFDLLRDHLRVSPGCKRRFSLLKHRFAGRSTDRYRAAKGALIDFLRGREPLASLLASRRSVAGATKTRRAGV
ncbi:MAG: GrpB family protein [Phycisphaerales bacterium]|nr:GrpB family protein [Planctomycetota bacterium]